MDKEMFLTLFKSIVRPHLEYGSNVWSVIYKKEAIQIENVHRRATKLVKKYTTSELHRTPEISWIAMLVLLFTCMLVLKALQSLCCMFLYSDFK
jgi:hypothetical protein